MNESGIARRYAGSLYEAAARQGVLDQLDGDIDILETAFDASRELKRLFESPVISRDKKQRVLTALLTDRVSQTTRSFIELMIRKKREHIFADVVRAYREMRDEELGIVEAVVRLPEEPSADEQKLVSDSLARHTGKTIRLRVEVDPELIGGAVIRLGDTVYDGSVRHKLAALRSQLAHGSFTTN